MKRYMKYNLLGLTTALMLGATACKDDTFSNFGEELGDEVKVTFHLSPEGALASTRADGTVAKISDGTKADILIYAVYDKDGNLLDEYGHGSFDETNFPAGVGQTILKPGEGFPMTLSITLKRDEEYQLAFWAQSSKAKNAYITDDLRKVEVNYSQVTDDAAGVDDVNSSSTPNNDEFRDAFCRSISLVAGQSGGVEQNIHLFRPLAQINVGTSGYDYEIATRETQNKYTYSKIRVNRVARYLDVVKDETYNSTTDGSGNDNVAKTPEAFAVVDFGWAPIPAYANMYTGDNVYNVSIPDYPSYTKWDWINDKDFVLHRDGKDIDKNAAIGEDGIGGIYGKEYFLTVHRDFNNKDNVMPDVKVQDKDGDGFRDYASLTGNYNKESETFKYLSMCYVLTSSTEKDPVVINNIKVWLATDADGSNEYELLNINQVPAQKNWRTNIIGNLLTEENKFEVKLDKDFAGEYSGWGPGWEWTGPLADGVYYDGENDVIEISSTNGLIWLQKMVNGKMKVREAADSKYVGKNYYYYDSNNKSTELVYDYIEEPSDPTLKERILVATHQKYNSNSNGEWPKDHNFHFTGTHPETHKDYPAKIRLMADIDLSAYYQEWIPIGFDGRFGEQLGWSIIPNDPDGYNATDDNASGRIFYGEFDGNGHTISNLSTKRFSANVHEYHYQKSGFRKVYTTDTRHPSDNPQWFGRGLFGQIGGNAKVNNVRLNNVDIYGCNGVAAVVAFAYGDAIEICNNIVDGGSIVATPMYRGDNYRENRTFARGVYMGGIVGYFNTDGGKVDNNIVRNVYMSAVRRSGGLIGSINQQWLTHTHEEKTEDEGKGLVDGSWKSQRESRPASISNNKLQNLTIIITSFNTYGAKLDWNGDNSDNIAKSGFGYNNGNLEMYSQKFVGGYDLDLDKRTDIQGDFKKTGNVENNVTIALNQIGYNKDEYYQELFDGKYSGNNKFVRIGKVQSLPLEHMPMLSSWYADYINLSDNYYGAPSAHTVVKLHDFKYWSGRTTKTGYTDDNTKFNDSRNMKNGGTNFYYPMNLPYDTEIDYDNNSPKVGVFVESVTLDGKGGIGGRSVITPVNVTGTDDCVMYITARNRHQFGGDPYLTGNKLPEYMLDFANDLPSSTFKVPTRVRNMVLRGEPYAHTGILLAPNKNMHRVELENVAIYDVYKTLALYDWYNITSQKIWPNRNEKYDALTRNDQYASPADVKNLPVIILRNCNLRGYTVPGTAWRYVNCFNTTFERGASTGHGEDEYTYKVESETNFDGCFFKAPFIIDMTSMADLSKVSFKNCHATSTSTRNKDLNPSGKTGCNKIVVLSNDKGEPYVEYYKDDTLLATETL